MDVHSLATPAWAWLLLAGLGAFHGLNPAMGWLFAVALGLQEKSGGAVARAIPPLALGHLLSMGAVVAVVALLGIPIPAAWIRIAVAIVLLAVGILKLVSSRHPRWARWSGMRAGFRDLTIWSFLAASAHGAGLMLLPVVLALPSDGSSHAMHHAAMASGLPWAAAVLIHTAAYLAATTLVAFVVYRFAGVGFLRRAWLNLDAVWGIALLAAGGLTLVV
ncbi:MAG TPA: hypothetical protein VMB25_01720 [Bryobacteraceae bacterium]|nr:hypothetical protein [Bryobacteraceae bacterium]